MSDHDNVVDFASHSQRAETSAAVVHTAVCLGMQRELYEFKIESLRRVNRALIVTAMTAYVLGIYCGFIIALERIYGP